MFAKTIKVAGPLSANFLRKGLGFALFAFSVCLEFMGSKQGALNFTNSRSAICQLVLSEICIFNKHWVNLILYVQRDYLSWKNRTKLKDTETDIKKEQTSQFY